jgi:hypothetical protein
MTEHLIASPRPAVRVGATAAAGGATITNVSIGVNRVDGKPAPYNFLLYLSDAASGAGWTAVTASRHRCRSLRHHRRDVVAKSLNVQTTAAGSSFFDHRMPPRRPLSCAPRSKAGHFRC